MRLLKVLILFIIIAGMGCLNTPKNILPWRWSFEGVDMPNMPGFLDSIRGDYGDGKDAMDRFFLGDKLILRKDNSFDFVLFKKYLHGNWTFSDSTNTLTLTDETGQTPPFYMRVDSITPALLQVKMDGAAFNNLIPTYEQNIRGASFFRQHGRLSFFFSADGEKYRNEKDDPYSKPNNLWRIKPAQPETNKQVFDRVQNHLLFWRLIVQDAIDRQRDYISFHWFESPLVIAANGAALRSYRVEKDEWDANFYDSLQAQAGYQLLLQCFHKGLKAGKTDSRFNNDIIIIDQMLANLKTEE